MTEGHVQLIFCVARSCIQCIGVHDRQPRVKKTFGLLLELCVSSLLKDHANLLCIVPILYFVPKDEKRVILEMETIEISIK